MNTSKEMAFYSQWDQNQLYFHWACSLQLPSLLQPRHFTNHSASAHPESGVTHGPLSHFKNVFLFLFFFLAGLKWQKYTLHQSADFFSVFICLYERKKNDSQLKEIHLSLYCWCYNIGNNNRDNCMRNCISS